MLEVEMRKDQREELSTNPERHVKPTHPLEGTTCPTCEKGTLVLRSSFYGSFLGCSRYPKCKNLTKLDKDGNVVEPKGTQRTSKGPSVKKETKGSRSKAKTKRTRSS